MYLTVGEISKTLGISTEAIRYYVQEGLISPVKNEGNSYWEYSSDDLMKLTDILFYRSMNLTMKEIKTILGGLPLEEIGSLVERRKDEMIEEIRASMESLHQLNEWSSEYRKEMNLLGKFSVGPMKSEFRREGCYEEPVHMARYLDDCFDIDKEDWGAVSISFYYNLNDAHQKMERYLSVAGVQKMKISSSGYGIIEEKADNCLITEVHYSDNVMEMIGPMIQYADAQGYELSGEFYGREDTNYFVDGKRTGIYKVYAVLKK